MTTRETRLERNQQTFRSANERFGDLVGGRVASEQALPFLCECPDDECMDTVSVTLGEYEHVHSNPNRYLVVSGHPTIESEHVVEDRDGYWIVEKGNDE